MLLDRLRVALQGRYEIDAEIGRGGMATVVRARDARHDRAVAVKVLHPELAEALGAERFLREVRITARLNHPHILPLLDSGDADGILYYVMPLVQGETLRERLMREGPLPVEEAITLAREVADALGYAHGLGIVHRDIKPENILLHGGHALVADFGIARAFDDPAAAHLTATGLAIGTPLYMSPEQAHGQAAVDGRSDLYSLACVTYEMLAGEPPVSGPTAMAIAARKLTEDPPPLRARRPSVPAAVETAVTRALARTPADRPRTAREFAAALGAAEPTDQARGPAPGAGGRAPAPRGAVLATATIAAGIVGLAAWLVLGREGTRAEAPSASASIAVLPFTTIGGDATRAYVAEGLADELVTSLAMVPGIRVASRTSSTVVAGQGLDLATIGQRLSVETVLEGSVRATGDSVRIATRLVKVADGYPMWSRVFETGAREMLRIHEEIASAIAAALTQGREGEAQVTIRSGTDDPVAYDLYLQGLSLSRTRHSERSVREALAFLRRAVERAPGFARAHAAIGQSLATQGWLGYEPAREVFPASARAAAQALRLDPRQAVAQATRAYAVLYHDWDLPGAEREFRRAIAMDPNDPVSHQWLGNALAVAQRWDEAEAQFRTAVTLDPLSTTRRATMIWVQHHRGDHARAVETYERLAATDSSNALAFQWGGMALLATGRHDDAVAAFRHALRLSDEGPGFAASLAHALAVRAGPGDREEARRFVERLRGARVVPAYELARITLALGERDAALAWLERALEARIHAMLFLRIDPAFASLQGDPAFEAIARRVGV